MRAAHPDAAASAEPAQSLLLKLARVALLVCALPRAHGAQAVRGGMPCRGGSGSADDKCMDDGDCVSACECIADVHRIKTCQGLGSTTGYCDVTNPALANFLFESFCDCVKKPGTPGILAPGGISQSECYASGGSSPGPLPTDGPAPVPTDGPALVPIDGPAPDPPVDGAGETGTWYYFTIDWIYKLTLDTIKVTMSSEPTWAGAHEVEVTCTGSDGSHKTTALPGVDHVGVLYEGNADIVTDAYLPLEGSDKIKCTFTERDVFFDDMLGEIFIEPPPASAGHVGTTRYSESAGSVEATFTLTRLAPKNVTLSCDAACGSGGQCDALVATALTVHPDVAVEESDGSPEIHVGCAKTLADLKTREDSDDGLFVTEDLEVTEGRYQMHRTLWTDVSVHCL